MTADSISSDPDLFEQAVASLARRPTFMAHLFSVALAGDVSASRIAAELNCTPANAIRIALMRAPRSEREIFLEDVKRIADAAGIDRMRLLAVVRQALALIAFEADPPAGRQQGILLAARDRVPGTGEQED